MRFARAIHYSKAAIAILMVLLVGISSQRAVFANDFKPIPRRIPPIGMELPESQRTSIESALKKLDRRLATLPDSLRNSELLADVRIYEKAVRFALSEREFYSLKDAGVALDEIATANRRLDSIAKGEHPWSSQKGLLVRGYRSAVDGSYQPYGLEIPADVDLAKPVPLYVWLHGRGDSDTDLHFIRGRETRKGQIHPPGAIVLHPFGRNCLGFKSAGEIDILDAIASVEHRYKIDPDRVVLMGFSMGGAGAWHVGAHYADHFVAVHAGAGFVDVAQYLHLKPRDYPAWYEQKLWGVYDVPDYVRDLFNVTTVGYGGEVDPQRASSQIMADAFAAEGRGMVRIVGPKMPHRYDPASLARIMGLMEQAVRQGRNRYPKQLWLQTRTLRYNQMFWASLTGLEQHWLDSRLDASAPDLSHIRVKTKNARSISLTSPWPAAAGPDRAIDVHIDDTPIAIHSALFNTGSASFVKTAAGWRLSNPSLEPSAGLQKVHGLQGPIDDAFLGPFLVVTPSGKCASGAVQKWIDFELPHFQQRWRDLFRGDLRIKRDTDVTPEDMKRFHLIAWGDPSSNRLIAQISDRLPIRWTDRQISIGDKTFDAATHVPVLIYPNPLNPSRYVVLNSGPTFREDSDKTNSLQNPKLPDWAIIDVTTGPDSHLPGKVNAADFFDEQWRVRR